MLRFFALWGVLACSLAPADEPNAVPKGLPPLRIPEVPIGSHVVRLELPNHHAWSGATTVVSGKDQRVTGSLEPIR